MTESATILVKTGHSPKELQRAFRDICRALDEPPQPFDPSSVPFVAGLAHIVAHWYTDPACLDERNLPLPLPLQSRGASLAKLIRRVLPQHDVETVVASLLRSRALQRRGRLYTPTDRYVAHTQDLSTGHVYGLTSLVGMLRTVQHNISCGDERVRLLERSATNPYVPNRALPEIHRRIKREITAVLWKLDGYLRTWEVEAGSEPTTRVGVGAYAYEDPIITGSASTEPGPNPFGRVRQTRRARVPRHR